MFERSPRELRSIRRSAATGSYRPSHPGGHDGEGTPPPSSQESHRIHARRSRCRSRRAVRYDDRARAVDRRSPALRSRRTARHGPGRREPSRSLDPHLSCLTVLRTRPTASGSATNGRVGCELTGQRARRVGDAAAVAHDGVVAAGRLHDRRRRILPSLAARGRSPRDRPYCFVKTI